MMTMLPIAGLLARRAALYAYIAWPAHHFQPYRPAPRQNGMYSVALVH